MMETDIEAACWRIWYRLKERGECSYMDLIANTGIKEGLFYDAIEALESFGQVEVGERDGAGNPATYRLCDEKARMMQVFPTLEGEE